MQIDYELTERDLIAFHVYGMGRESEHRRSVRKNRWVALVGGGLALAAGLALGSLLTAALGGLWMLAGVFMGLVYRRMIRRTIRRQAKRGELRSMLVPTRLTVSPEGLISERPAGTATLRWDAVDGIAETEGHVFVHEDPDRAWIIPKRALEPEPGVEAFFGELRQRTGDRFQRPLPRSD